MRMLSIFLIFILTSTNLCADPSLDKNSKIKFGILLTLSGGYAVAGEDQKLGITEALKGHPLSNRVDLVYADSRNDASAGISEFKKMALVDKVTAVFLNRAKVAIPLNPTSQEYKIPILGTVGHDDFVSGNDYAFQVWPKASEEGSFLARKSIESGTKKVAIIYAEDEYMTSVSHGFKDTIISLNGEVVSFESILLDTFDVRSLLLKIKKKNPDTLYVNVSVPQISPIVKQIREMGIKAQILSNIYVAKSEVLNSASHEIFEGIKYAEIDTNLPILKKSLGLKENESIQALTVSSYVGMLLLLQTYANLNGEDFYQSLLKQKEIKTPDYTYRIENRYIKFPLIIKKIMNGAPFNLNN